MAPNEAAKTSSRERLRIGGRAAGSRPTVSGATSRSVAAEGGGGAQQGGGDDRVALDPVRDRVRVAPVAEQVAELEGAHGDGGVRGARQGFLDGRRDGPVATAGPDQHQAGAAGRAGRPRAPGPTWPPRRAPTRATRRG